MGIQNNLWACKGIHENSSDSREFKWIQKIPSDSKFFQEIIKRYQKFPEILNDSKELKGFEKISNDHERFQKTS